MVDGINRPIKVGDILATPKRSRKFFKTILVTDVGISVLKGVYPHFSLKDNNKWQFGRASITLRPPAYAYKKNEVGIVLNAGNLEKVPMFYKGSWGAERPIAVSNCIGLAEALDRIALEALLRWREELLNGAKLTNDPAWNTLLTR